MSWMEKQEKEESSRTPRFRFWPEKKKKKKNEAAI